jgi:tRNA-uridine 2-sulfurtransferase
MLGKVEKKNNKKIVYLMLSGGVDSSVAASILSSNPDYIVKCVFMKCWSLETLRSMGFSDNLYACTWEDDARDAQMVALKLGIDFEIWDFQKEYSDYVVGYMLNEYSLGRTPNPDVMCNSVVKFGAFYDSAIKLGADYVATGHYAKIIQGQDGLSRIGQAKDIFKDQSYFLWKIPFDRLQKTLFPIGEIDNKLEVRKTALSKNLVTAGKKDSQGLCFVGKTSLKGMLLNKFGEKSGNIVTQNMDNVHKVMQVTNRVKDEFTKTGMVVLGQHKSSILFTIGQRDGLGIGGGPWFVSKIDIERNLVFVVHEDEITEIEKNTCLISSLNVFEPIIETQEYYAQIRYNQTPEPCLIEIIDKDIVKVNFKNKIKAFASGQSCVVYKKNSTEMVLILGGIIS